jgi:DNA-binding NarL/FixJ family response regulator
VPDGFALVDAVTAKPADLVLIGIHRATSCGAEATTLLLGMHPTTVIIVFGSPRELDVLAAAYVRGARGLLTWDPEQSPPGFPAADFNPR